MGQGEDKPSPLPWRAEVGRVSEVAGRLSVEPGEGEEEGEDVEQGDRKGSPIVWTAEVGRVSVVAGRASVEPGEDEDVEQGDRKGQYISKRETRVGYRTGDHKGP